MLLPRNRRDVNAQFVYSKQGVSPLLVRAEVLGSETPIRVWNYDGRICVPQLGEVDGFGTFHKVLAPPSFHRGALPLIYKDDGEPIVWGRQVHLPDGESIVGMYLLEFDLSDAKDTARNQMSQVEMAIDSWFDALRDWLEVLTHQDLSISEPVGGTASQGNYRWSWRSPQGWTNASASVGYLQATMPDLSTAVAVPTWLRAIQCTSQGERPRESHLILRDARARLRREQFNYSAIFSGIAAEIAIKNGIERVLRTMGTPGKFVEQVTRATLGTLEITCKNLGIALTAETHKNLTEVRNRAAHRNTVVTRLEAPNALESATQIIEQFEPI